LALVDTSRPPNPHRDVEGSDERRLVVEVWYPADASAEAPEARDVALARGGAPYPLIVFAHGFMSFRHQSAAYTQHLASHGYVVASPDFPLTHGGAPGGATFLDLENQPGDVSFVIDELLARSADETSPFAGAIDGDAVGVTGHSFGAFTTILTTYGEYRDERVDAALPISGSGCMLSEEQVGDTAVPVLVLAGSEDLFIAASASRAAYARANPPRYWVNLFGGNHIRFTDLDLDDAGILETLFGGNTLRCEGDPEPGVGAETLTLERQQELLRAFATPFFDAYLKGSAEAKRFLQKQLAPDLGDDVVEFEFQE
jgi:predicted dienelactone hydrolase